MAVNEAQPPELLEIPAERSDLEFLNEVKGANVNAFKGVNTDSLTAGQKLNNTRLMAFHLQPSLR